MKDFLIYAILVIFIAAPVAYLTAWVIFRKSFLAKIGYGMVTTVVVGVLASYYIAIEGLIHLAWGAGITIVTMVIFLRYLKKDITLLQKLSKQLKNMSDMDISEEVDTTALNRKDELGEISNSLSAMNKR